MNFRKLGLPVLFAAASLAGCSSRSAPPPNAPGSSTSAETRKDAFRAAVNALHDQVHADKDAIVGVSQDDVTWNDSCLGCPKAGESCLQVLTPGYRIVLRAGDATYEYHTDLGGRARLCQQSPATGSTAPAYPPPSGYPQPTPTPYL